MQLFHHLDIIHSLLADIKSFLYMKRQICYLLLKEGRKKREREKDGPIFLWAVATPARGKVPTPLFQPERKKSSGISSVKLTPGHELPTQKDSSSSAISPSTRPDFLYARRTYGCSTKLNASSCRVHVTIDASIDAFLELSSNYTYTRYICVHTNVSSEKKREKVEKEAEKNFWT